MDWSTLSKFVQSFVTFVTSQFVAYVWYIVGSTLLTYMMWRLPKRIRAYFSERDPIAQLRQRLRSFRVVHLPDIIKASDQEVREYYVGRQNLNWNIVVSGAIIKRTVKDLILARYAQVPAKREIICIHGDAASGKSAVAWDVAFTMAVDSKSQVLLLQDLNKESVGWQDIENLFYDQTKPVIVVVDDIFDRIDYVDRMVALPDDIPLRIIASSRTSDIPQAFAKSFDQFAVGAPDEQEVRQAKQVIVGVESERILKTPPKSWLALMIELSSNQSFEDYIEKTTLKLTSNADAYQAYLYVCFCSQFNVPLLGSVITTLLPGIRDLPRSLAGYIFSQEFNKQRAFVTAHAAIADIVIQNVYCEPPQQLLQKILRGVDCTVLAQRQFVIALLSAIHTRQRAEYHAYLCFDAPELHPLLTHVAHAELLRLSGILDTNTSDSTLHNMQQMLSHKLLDCVPTTAEDWQAYFVLNNRVSHRATFDVIAEARKFITSDDNQLLRVRFLQFIGNVPQSAAIESLITEAQSWVHNDSTADLVVALASVAHKRGSREQRQQVLVTITNWMNIKGLHNTVFDLYVSLVGDIGKVAYADAIAWAKQKLPVDASSHSRKSYLRLLELNGDQQAIRALYEQLDQTGVEQYNSEAFEILLMVVTALDDPHVTSAVIEKHLHAIDQIALRKTSLLCLLELGDSVLAEFPHDKNVRTSLENMLTYVSEWMKGNRDANVYAKYVDLIISLDNNTLGIENIRELMVWIDAEAHTIEGLKYYINFLKLSAWYADQSMIQAQIPRAVDVLGLFPDNMHLRLALMNVIYKYYGMVRLALAEQTREPIKRFMLQTFVVLREQQDQLQQVNMTYYKLLHQFVRLCARDEDTPFVLDVITQVLQWFTAKLPRREWSHSCTSVITLIRIKGSWTHVTQIVELGKKWLASSTFSQMQKEHMRSSYAQLIEECGNDDMKLDFYVTHQQWGPLLLLTIKILQQNPLKTLCLEHALLSASKLTAPDMTIMKLLLIDAHNWVLLNPTNVVLSRYVALVKKYGDRSECAHAYERMKMFRDARPHVVISNEIWSDITTLRQRV
jgi:hypothetical protein